MPDDNKQFNNGSSLENNQWEEKEWQAKNNYAREVMARQEQEIAESKAAEAKKKEAAEELSSDDDRASQFQERLSAERRQAIANQMARSEGVPEEDAGVAPNAALDARIATLQKRVSGSYHMTYLLLTVGAATVDVLQAILDLTSLLAVLSSAIGIIFSVIRYFGLKYANPGSTFVERNKILQRTFISGAISFIPYANLLPEQAAYMIREYTIKRERIAADEGELKKLRAQKAKRQS